ncbi:MAG: metal ABC transporter solute-binding protein, Zn/Mn family [Methanomassiliicoccales archaeon]
MKAGKALSAILLCLMICLPTAGCLDSGEEDNTGEEDNMVAVVSTIPVKQMVEGVGGDLVEVTSMVQVGESPHDYGQLSSQLLSVERADVYFKSGASLEFELENMDKIRQTNPDMMMVDCSHNLTVKEWEDHYGDSGGQSGIDPHVWLSPTNAMKMVWTIHQALVELDPANETRYDQNLQTYLGDLEDLREDLDAMLSPYQGRKFLTYHPSWGYFGDEFDLHQIAIEEAGKEPESAGIQAIIQQAEELGIDVIFVSPQFDTSRAQVIAEEIGGVVVKADPLTDDYFQTLRDLANEMVEGFSEE